jgi:CheY-like chemotaxis protein
MQLSGQEPPDSLLEKIMVAMRKVLVVDDDPVVGKSFNRVLTRKGYAVITAHNAAEALEQMRTSDVDLLITDIRMPGMSGLELAEAVKARKPWTPIMIVTGYGTEADEARARAAGVTSFQHKPMSPEMIEGATAEAIAAPRQAAPAELAIEATAAAPAEATDTGGHRLRNMALFAAAPIIGLAYAIFLPLVGLGTLAWIGGRQLMKSDAARANLKFAAMTLAAPLIGLAFAVLAPLAALAALAWTAARALAARPAVRFTAAALAAPFIGLAYIVIAPVAGLAALLWTAGRALTGHKQAA